MTHDARLAKIQNTKVILYQLQAYDRIALHRNDVTLSAAKTAFVKEISKPYLI